MLNVTYKRCTTAFRFGKAFLVLFYLIRQHKTRRAHGNLQHHLFLALCVCVCAPVECSVALMGSESQHVTDKRSSVLFRAWSRPELALSVAVWDALAVWLSRRSSDIVQKSNDCTSPLLRVSAATVRFELLINTHATDERTNYSTHWAPRRGKAAIAKHGRCAYILSEMKLGSRPGSRISCSMPLRNDAVMA